MNSTSHVNAMTVESTIHYKLFVWGIVDTYQLLHLGY